MQKSVVVKFRHRTTGILAALEYSPFRDNVYPGGLKKAKNNPLISYVSILFTKNMIWIYPGKYPHFYMKGEKKRLERISPEFKNATFKLLKIRKRPQYEVVTLFKKWAESLGESLTA